MNSNGFSPLVLLCALNIKQNVNNSLSIIIVIFRWTMYKQDCLQQDKGINTVVTCFMYMCIYNWPENCCQLKKALFVIAIKLTQYVYLFYEIKIHKVKSLQWSNHPIIKNWNLINVYWIRSSVRICYHTLDDCYIIKQLHPMYQSAQ